MVKVQAARGKEGGRCVAGASSGRTGDSGVHRQFENRRRLPAVPLTPRQKFVGTVADFSATQKERVYPRIPLTSVEKCLAILERALLNAHRIKHHSP